MRTGEAGIDPGRILLIKTHAIGDVLMTTPAIREIRKRFPCAEISMLVGKWSKDVVWGSRDIDEVIAIEDEVFMKPEIPELIRLLLSLRRRKFDMAVCFHRSSRIHLLALLAGAKVRVGLSPAGRSLFLNRPVKSSDEIDLYPVLDYGELSKSLGAPLSSLKMEMPVTSDGEARTEKLLKSWGVSVSDRLVAFCPGGAKNPAEEVLARLWPVERFAQVAELAARELGAKILVAGSDSDRMRTSGMLSHMSEKAIDATGMTTLPQLAALFKRCSLVVTNDSAPLHISVAAGTPVVALFGPTSAKGRLPEPGKNTGIQSRMQCSPCYSFKRFPGCDNARCIDAIEVSEVFSAVKEVLSR
jgi:heptosyltransferase-2